MWRGTGYQALPSSVISDSNEENEHSTYCIEEQQVTYNQSTCPGVKDKAARKKERLNAELLIAVPNSDLNRVERLLKDGADPQATCRPSMCSAVHLAAFRGQVNILRLLLEEGAKCDCRDIEGRQPVHYACFAGHLSTLEVLLETKPDLINSTVEIPAGNDDWARDLLDSWNHDHKAITEILPDIRNGSTPLHITASLNHIWLVDYLLNRAANVNCRDGRGLTTLDVAGCKGTSPNGDNTSDKALYDIVNALIKKGARSSVQEATDGLPTVEVTALHTAVASENITLIDLLMENDANLFVFNERGETPLHLAVGRKLYETLKAVLSWLSIDMIDIKNSAGLTALHQAVQDKWTDGVDLLLEAGADVNVDATCTQEKALHMAAKIGLPILLEELLTVESSSEIINSIDSQMFTPLFRAIEAKNVRCVEILVTHGAKLNMHLSGGRNVLHFAAECKAIVIMNYLIKLDVVRRELIDELCAVEGLSALHIAAKTAQFEMASVLIANGADVSLASNGKPSRKYTALHLAARSGCRKTVDAILPKDDRKKCIALLNSRDKLDWTPLHTAAVHGHGDCVETLLKGGANIADNFSYHGVQKSALDIMLLNVPNCVDRLEKLMGYNITHHSEDSPDYQVKLNYDILLGPTNSDPAEDRQMIFLNTVLNNGNPVLQEKLLLHTLVQTFLFYKWMKMKKFFYILFSLYGLFTILFTIFSVTRFVINTDISVLYGYIIMIFFLIPITIIEILQVIVLKKYYLLDTENCIKWAGIVTSVLTIILDSSKEETRHFASAAVLLTWAELLFLLGRFRECGLHVLMFEKVAANIFQVL